MSKIVSVELFCTDRGQHPRRELCWVIDDNGVARLRWKAYGHGAFGSKGRRVAMPAYAGIIDSDRTRGNNVKCPKCRRSPSLSTAHLATLLRSGVSEVDISYLSQ